MANVSSKCSWRPASGLAGDKGFLKFPAHLTFALVTCVSGNGLPSPKSSKSLLHSLLTNLTLQGLPHRTVLHWEGTHFIQMGG